MLVWRNGSRGGFRNRCSKGRGGSNPSTSTTSTKLKGKAGISYVSYCGFDSHRRHYTFRHSGVLYYLMAKSSWARAVAKSAVWKVIGVATLVAVSIAAGISAVEIGKITIAYHVITLFLYVAHERIWNKITWGKREHHGNDHH